MLSLLEPSMIVPMDVFRNLIHIQSVFGMHLFLLVGSSHKRVTVDLLSEGLNKAVAVVGKVLFLVKHESVTPL